jgi:uncharacterized damage-inducible protein DinB
MSQAVNREGLLALYQYNFYANQLVLDVAAKLSPQEWDKSASPSHGSVHALLAHMLGCETFFFCQAADQPEPFDSEQLSSLAEIRRLWSALEQEQRRFINGLSAEQIMRPVSITLRGQALVFPVWEMLMQGAIHSTHHRGELSIVLTELGYPLPTLDILLHFIQQSGQPNPFA